jgi:aminoglycoside phosphotransferase (APT) family kinase protein
MTDGDGDTTGAKPNPDAGGASRYLDTQGVYRYVADRLGRASDWALSPHAAGLGNETLFLVWDHRQFVLRRPPLDGAPADAHDPLREYRALVALDGTDLPTPRPVLACGDASVAGAPFTVVDRLDGDVLRHGEPVSYAASDHRHRVGAEMVDTLAAIHGQDLDALDVDGDEPALSHPPLAERVTTWRDRFARYRAATDRPVPGAGDVAEWLAANVPDPVEPTLVHGDFTLANVVFTRAAPPDLVGVLDWERAGIGDPRLDLARLLVTWFETEDERAGLPYDLAPGFTTRDGYPCRTDLRDRYEEATGRTYDHDRFFRAFAYFELAAVCEAYYCRHCRGISDRPSFAALDEAVPRLVERAQAVVDGDEPL